ncbi:NAD(P)/FAD-dependent oxidoreductase [Mesorhizobium sp. ES1-1]|uniref:NAD(P)/FAD-dependent oxidoreductase n=1 Tax=Mesorhizobium sp. ES1-1 TaxID=2876629 RepID=UPI001CCA87CE|nr:FAD-binding oxidoreductase [Mesorhizobium sp. ES1-1]MBZ9676234.1 FAD-binding oxidoreductase [Mesorhizobium sp. ES1-1]
MSAAEQTEIIIVGGGIAGAGAAFEISRSAKLVLLERESHCGYHTTGRSAASFTENYGNGIIRRIVLASRSFLTEPPTGFCDYPLLSKRGMITVARADQLDLLREDMAAARALVPSIAAMSPAEAIARVPVLRADYLAGAYIEPHSKDIDVNGLHQGYLRGARARGARIVTNAGVIAVDRQGGQWQVETPAGTFLAPTLVNAAGAWGDEVAVVAGVRPVGLQPKRRTAFNIPAPAGVDIADWPLVNDVGAEFYFKPDAGQLFVSPADATPSEPMDAYAEDIDVAIGAERLERATTIEVQRVSRSWAGLRTFVADGSPVVGPDDEVPDFIWLVGQGGYGIKTSPALSRVCASLIARTGLPDDVARQGVMLDDLTPHRLRGVDLQAMQSAS